MGTNVTAFLQGRIVLTNGGFSADNLTFKIVEASGTTLDGVSGYSFLVATGAGAASLTGTTVIDASAAPGFAAYAPGNVNGYSL